MKKKVQLIALGLVTMTVTAVSVLAASHVRAPESLEAQVGRLIALPTNEIPTIATVSDSKKLLGQPFFANSQNGDKVLIYPKAQKAYLYRPRENKLIDVTVINVTAP